MSSTTELTPTVTTGLMAGPSTIATVVVLLLLALRFFGDRARGADFTAHTFFANLLCWIRPRVDPVFLFTLSMFFSIAFSLPVSFADPMDQSVFFVSTTAGLFIFFCLLKLAFLLLIWPGADDDEQRFARSAFAPASASPGLAANDTQTDHASPHSEPENSNG